MKKSLLIVVIILVMVFIICKISQKKDEVEVKEIEELDGKIVLYFKNNDTKELEKEYRNVSMQKIKDDMPKTIIEETLKGPTSENLVSTIPERNKIKFYNYRWKFNKD